MIEVKNLVKKYGNHVAVKDLSFTVEDGQVYGFLGPNGAGKSTTMNIMIGYLSATEGEVVINGHDIFEEPEEAKKCFGYLPENPPLYTNMTVKEYLMFVADLKKVPKKERKEMIEKIMRMTHIEEMQNRLIQHLSKGYKQRVGLAQAIVGFPEIIILDEPTSGLDPKQQKEVRDLIRQLSKNHTVILSSHILQEINAVCDRILIINKGHLVAEGTPEELTELVQGSQEIRVTAKADKKQVEAVLNTLKNVHRVEYQASEEPGTTSVVVYAKKEQDIREELFKAFVKHDIVLLALSAYTKNLEDVFLEITEGGKADKRLSNGKKKSAVSNERKKSEEKQDEDLKKKTAEEKKEKEEESEE